MQWKFAWRVTGSPEWVAPRLNCGTHLERAQQTLIDAHHGACIVEFAAIIGCTEKGDELSFGEELVAVFDDLMRTTDEVHIVLLQESRDDIRAEGEGHASVVLAPSSDILVRI